MRSNLEPKPEFTPIRAFYSSPRRIIVPRSWRSVCGRLFLFTVTSLLAIELQSDFPETLVPVPLLGLNVVFPLMLLPPLFLLISAIRAMFDSVLIIDHSEVRATIGLVSLIRRESVIPYGYVYGISLQQSFFDRLMGVFNIRLGTSSTGKSEILIEGITEGPSVKAEIEKRNALAANELNNAGLGSFSSD